MHLLAVTPGVVSDGAEAVDLGLAVDRRRRLLRGRGARPRRLVDRVALAQRLAVQHVLAYHMVLRLGCSIDIE